ncbi:MAG: TIGR01777 family oxidoreductase [Bacteroidales bacterium]|jgi:hypothetical protein|nr:TIGR01777 family oxidoreductase [Bacteroidales bacterium]
MNFINHMAIIENKKSIMITGGSGLVGRYLTSLLLAEGYKVSHLSRKQDQFGRVRVFRWDPGKQIVAPEIFEGIDYIIHLAGANIGEKRWTKKRKEEIRKSRVDSAQLIYRVITENSIPLKAFISASAVGYYGSVTSETILTENDHPTDDFLGITCRLWEEAACKFEKSGTRSVRIRTAVVLEKSDSALARMLIPARLGIFPRFGNGRQYMPWIHITDLCRIYLKAIQDDNMNGAYNAVAPEGTTNLRFMKTLARVMNRSGLCFPVPSFVLRTIFGEMSSVILKGTRVSAEKIMKAGFQFNYINLHEALDNIINN